MKQSFYIRVPDELINTLLASGTHPSNRWYREALLATARMLDGRLNSLAAMRKYAGAIAALTAELEWSCRRLDLCTSTHPGDRDLSQMIRVSHTATEADLQECLRQLSMLGEHLAAALGTSHAALLRHRAAANEAVRKIFLSSPPTSALSAVQAIALLAVACDVVPPPPAERFAPVLTAALEQKLVAPGFVADSTLTAVPKKDLSENGKVVKLSLTADEYDLVNDSCARLGLPGNRFAIASLRCHVHDKDPVDEIMFDGLREIVVTLEALLHTAVACGVAARRALLLKRTDHDFLNRIDKFARKVYGAAADLLQLFCGAAVPHAPHFQTAVRPLLNHAATLVRKSMEPLCTPLLDYFVALKVLT